jgi:hypothetical protein
MVQRNTGLGGADFRAVAAIGALFGIDNIFGIGRGDSLFRAFRKTGVAHDAVIGNFESQKFLPYRQPTRIRFFA